MSGITYRYEQSYSFMKKGIKHKIKESVIDGNKGLTIMFLDKKDNEFYKIYIKEIEKDKYEVVEKKGEVEQPKQIVDEKDVLKMLKTHKLETIINYMSKERGTYKTIKMEGGVKKKRSKKVTKK